MKNTILGLIAALVLQGAQLVGFSPAEDENENLSESKVTQTILEWMATFPITKPSLCHQELFQELLGNKSQDEIERLVEVVKIVVDGTIHPYQYYQFLLLATHFEEHDPAKRLSANATSGTNPYILANENGLGFIGIGKEIIVSKEEAEQWIGTEHPVQTALYPAINTWHNHKILGLVSSILSDDSKLEAPRQIIAVCISQSTETEAIAAAISAKYVELRKKRDKDRRNKR